MEKEEGAGDEEFKAEGWQQMSAFAGSMALKCAVELRIADIIQAHGGPTTLSRIASEIPSSTRPDMSYLERIMRLLVLKNIFTASQSSSSSSSSDGGDSTVYGLTHLSRWILRDSKPSLAPILLMENYNGHSRCSNQNGDVWDFALTSPEFNSSFDDHDGDDGAAETSDNVDVLMDVYLPAYRDQVQDIASMVDVGGGTGRVMNDIAKAYPHIKAINFDLPHVVASAPSFPGVSHVGGDMFEAVPNADVALLKGILHDWSDEECVKIFKNCRKAIPEKNGRVIVEDIVVEQEENSMFGESQATSGLTSRKERTEVEWMKLLKEGGFPHYKIIKFPAKQCIIVAFPI